MISANKVTIYIIAATSIIILSISYFFLYPTIQKTQKSKKTIASTQEQTAAAQNQNATMEKINAQKDLIKTLGTEADNLVPKDPKLEDFLIQLETLIAQSKTPNANFQVSSLTSTTPANASSTLSAIKNARIYQFNVDGQGTLQDVLDLHNKLITMERLAEITSFNLTTGADDSMLSFQMQGHIFSLNPQTITTIKLGSPTKILQNAKSKININRVYNKKIEVKKEPGFGRVNPFLGF